MELGYLIGWIGLGFGVLVPLPQLHKMIKTKKSNDVSLLTYSFLCLAMIGYLTHAVYISAPVFIVAQALNLTTNGVIFGILAARRFKYGKK